MTDKYPPRYLMWTTAT